MGLRLVQECMGLRIVQECQGHWDIFRPTALGAFSSFAHKPERSTSQMLDVNINVLVLH